MNEQGAHAVRSGFLLSLLQMAHTASTQATQAQAQAQAGPLPADATLSDWIRAGVPPEALDRVCRDGKVGGVGGVPVADSDLMCKSSSVLLVVAFGVAVAVTVAMVVQVGVGSMPRGYPLLGLLYTVMLLMQNMAVVSLMLDMFLPRTLDRVLFGLLVGVQGLTALVMTFARLDSVPARVLCALLLAVQVPLMVALFVRRQSLQVGQQQARCSIMERVLDLSRALTSVLPGQTAQTTEEREEQDREILWLLDAVVRRTKMGMLDAQGTALRDDLRAMVRAVCTPPAPPAPPPKAPASSHRETFFW
jgi:hypothetical protein